MATVPTRSIPDPPPGFMRTMVQVNFRSVIRSSCDYCGVIITGTTAEAVWADETEHREYCCAPKKKPGAATPGQ